MQRTVLPVNIIPEGGVSAMLIPWDAVNGNEFPMPQAHIIVVLLAMEPSVVTVAVPLLVDNDLVVADRIINLAPGVPFLWPIDRVDVYAQADNSIHLGFSTPGSIGIYQV